MTARPHPLDDPVREALGSVHAPLRREQGRAQSYRADVAPFSALPSDDTAADWADLADVLGPGGVAVLLGGPGTPPPTWRTAFTMDAFQMTFPRPAEPQPSRVGPTLVPLGADDVPAMLDLVAEAKPGPFLTATIEMGRYVGVKIDGELVAMGGERLRLPGWTEVSAICCTPRLRGTGLASAVVADVVAGIHARGEDAFLHVTDGNPALALYERLGFGVRRRIRVRGHRVPA